MALNKFSNPNTVKFWGAASDDDAAEAALAATGYSPSLRIPRRAGRGAIHLIWSATGTPQGTFTLYYSLLPAPDESTDTEWVVDTTAVFMGTGAATGGAAGNTMIIAGNLPAGGWWRLKWTRTSGTLNVRGWASHPEPRE